MPTECVVKVSTSIFLPCSTVAFLFFAMQMNHNSYNQEAIKHNQWHSILLVHIRLKYAVPIIKGNKRLPVLSLSYRLQLIRALCRKTFQFSICILNCTLCFGSIEFLFIYVCCIYVLYGQLIFTLKVIVNIQ